MNSTDLERYNTLYEQHLTDSQVLTAHFAARATQRVTTSSGYGFLRGQAHALRARIQLLLLNLVYGMPPLTAPIKSKATRVCPCCEHEMACVGVSRPM